MSRALFKRLCVGRNGRKSCQAMGNPPRGIVDGMPGAKCLLCSTATGWAGGFSATASSIAVNCVAVVLTVACLDPKVVSAWRVPNQRCWHVGQLVGSCMMIAPARAVDEPAHLPSLQDYVAQNKDFLVGTAGAVATVAGSYFTYLQADGAFRASDEYKIQAAVQDFLKPYQPKKKEKEVVKRDIMNTTKKRITEWSQQTEKATIVSGRFQSGKTVAVNEALRGVRGVFQFDVKSADWEKLMYEKLGVSNEGMFKEVLRRVRRELEKFPDNPTKFPILLVHREVVGGGHSAKKR